MLQALSEEYSEIDSSLIQSATQADLIVRLLVLKTNNTEALAVSYDLSNV